MSTINGGTLLTQAGTMASYTNRNKQLAVLATILAQANAGTPISGTATQEDILATEIGLDQLSSQELLGIVINQFQNLNDGTIPLPTTFNSLVTFNGGFVDNGTATFNGASTFNAAVAIASTLTTRGMTVNQVDGTATNPYKLLNGNWGNLTPTTTTFPIPYLQNANAGGMAFDLMYKGAGRGAVWMDICGTDVSLDSANWDCLHLGGDNTDASTTYYHVGVNKGGANTIKPLLIQRNLTQGTAGTYLGLGGFGVGDLPLVAIQARFQTDANLGFDSLNTTETASVLSSRFQAFNNAGTGIPLEIKGSRVFMQVANNVNYSFAANGAILLKKAVSNDNTTLIATTMRATKNIWSFDANEPAAAVFAQFRPATNVQVTIDATGANGRISGLSDTNTPIAINFQALSFNWSVDSGATQKVTIDTSGRLNAVGGISTGTAASIIVSTTALTNGAGVGAGTLTTAPSAGNPTKWIGINDNGTIRYVPAW